LERLVKRQGLERELRGRSKRMLPEQRGRRRSLDRPVLADPLGRRRESSLDLLAPQVALGGADRTQPADLDSAGRPRASRGACRSRTNADDCLPPASLGRV
jgi:hypothetical protein